MTKIEEKELEKKIFELARKDISETPEYINKSIENAIIKFEKRNYLFIIIKIIVVIAVVAFSVFYIIRFKLAKIS